MTVPVPFTIVATLPRAGLDLSDRLRNFTAMTLTDPIRDMPSTTPAAPTCPICAGEMLLTGAFPVAFAGGGSDHVLKYACHACHVEMNRTVKTPSVVAA